MTACSDMSPAVNLAMIDWVLRSLPQLQPPLELLSIGGGRSNLTFLVKDAGGRSIILRRPPLGRLLPSAHDMRREHRILTAVQRQVPVPVPLALCEDAAVTSRPSTGATYARATRSSRASRRSSSAPG
jgi:aminoglycoside phosphotransferase (APT) family kinase protein